MNYMSWVEPLCIVQLFLSVFWQSQGPLSWTIFQSQFESDGTDMVVILVLFIRARFLSLAWSKLRLGSANHRAGYFSNLACDWLSIVWAFSEQGTENGPWSLQIFAYVTTAQPLWHKQIKRMLFFQIWIVSKCNKWNRVRGLCWCT